jgi:hypothetical protein
VESKRAGRVVAGKTRLWVLLLNTPQVPISRCFIRRVEANHSSQAVRLSCPRFDVPPRSARVQSGRDRPLGQPPLQSVQTTGAPRPREPRVQQPQKQPPRRVRCMAQCSGQTTWDTRCPLPIVYATPLYLAHHGSHKTTKHCLQVCIPSTMSSENPGRSASTPAVSHLPRVSLSETFEQHRSVRTAFAVLALLNCLAAAYYPPFQSSTSLWATCTLYLPVGWQQHSKTSGGAALTCPSLLYSFSASAARLSYSFFRRWYPRRT